MALRVSGRRLPGLVVAICGGVGLLLGVGAIDDGLFGGLYLDSRELGVGVAIAILGVLLVTLGIMLATQKNAALRRWSLGVVGVVVASVSVVELVRNTDRDELFWTTQDGRFILFKTTDDGEVRTVRDFGPHRLVMNRSTRKVLVVPEKAIREPRWYESSALVLDAVDDKWEEIVIPYKFVGPHHSP